ncbi:MAG: hypothetical protein JNL82_08180 [Myxococcales bacterium]|nr:hypothetical protein [Myxococcales bacterium]
MLPGDNKSAAVEESQQFRDVAAPQFWDGEQKLGLEVARSLAVPDWVAWDIYLFYPPGVEWQDSGLPPPEAVLVQANGVVVGTKGTLPAKGDQSSLPPGFSDRAVVVGAQSELPELLSQVAVPYARRFAKP